MADAAEKGGGEACGASRRPQIAQSAPRRGAERPRGLRSRDALPPRTSNSDASGLGVSICGCPRTRGRRKGSGRALGKRPGCRGGARGRGCARAGTEATNERKKMMRAREKCTGDALLQNGSDGPYLCRKKKEKRNAPCRGDVRGKERLERNAKCPVKVWKLAGRWTNQSEPFAGDKLHALGNVFPSCFFFLTSARWRSERALHAGAQRKKQESQQEGASRRPL